MTIDNIIFNSPGLYHLHKITTRCRVKKSELFNRILDEVEQSDGRIALASATFELVGAPALDVRFIRTYNGR